jgi:hypothetical protein
MLGFRSGILLRDFLKFIIFIYYSFLIIDSSAHMSKNTTFDDDTPCYVASFCVSG